MTTTMNERPIQLSPWLIRLLRLPAFGVIAYAIIRHGFIRPFTIHGVDFVPYWDAARAVIESRSTYIDRRPDDSLWLAYLYPQWPAMAFSWMAFLPMERAEVVLKIGMLAALAACWAIAWRGFNPRRPWALDSTIGAPMEGLAATVDANWALVVGLFVAAFSPALASSLFVGQIDPLNALLAMALVGCLIAGWPRLAGAYWAMLCLIKVMPVFLLLPLLLWRQWRVIQTWIAFLACYLAILLITHRLKHEIFYVQSVVPEIPYFWRWKSGSLHRFISLVAFPLEFRENKEFYTRLCSAVSAALLAVYAGAMLGARRRRIGLGRALEIAILFIPLFSPLFEGHHMSVAMPVLFLQLARWMRGGMARWAAPALTVGWLVVALDFSIYDLYQISLPGSQFVVPGGAFWLLIVTLIEAWTSAPEIHAADTGVSAASPSPPGS